MGYNRNDRLYLNMNFAPKAIIIFKLTLVAAYKVTYPPRLVADGTGLPWSRESTIPGAAHSIKHVVQRGREPLPARQQRIRLESLVW